MPVAPFCMVPRGTAPFVPTLRAFFAYPRISRVMVSKVETMVQLGSAQKYRAFRVHPLGVVVVSADPAMPRAKHIALE